MFKINLEAMFPQRFRVFMVESVSDMVLTLKAHILRGIEKLSTDKIVSNGSNLSKVEFYRFRPQPSMYVENLGRKKTNYVSGKDDDECELLGRLRAGRMEMENWLEKRVGGQK